MTLVIIGQYSYSNFFSPGIPVGNVEATDADQTEINYRISFRIASSAGSNNFLINAKRLGHGWYQGTLRLDPDIALDYDRLQQKFFNLTVQAENFGETEGNATTLVRVNVLDVNDESPTIVPSPLSDLEVLENITQHELVTTLQASDLDTNHSLVFQELTVACFNKSASAGHVCQNWFRLEPNGSLFVNSPEINYEACDLVEIVLRVKDEFTEVGDPYSRNGKGLERTHDFAYTLPPELYNLFPLHFISPTFSLLFRQGQCDLSDNVTMLLWVDSYYASHMVYPNAEAHDSKGLHK